MTEQKRPLTALEAAMLGLYEKGARWIATDDYGYESAELWAYTSEPYLDGGLYYNSNRGEGCCTFSCAGVEACGLEVVEPLELLPWLTAHIPPEMIPEVEK